MNFTTNLRIGSLLLASFIILVSLPVPTQAATASTARMTARGITLPASSSSNSTWTSTSAANMNLMGTAGNNSLQNVLKPGATLTGGAGDDIYYTAWPDDGIVELAKGGIDTIRYYGDGPPYIMPPNIENIGINSGIVIGNKSDNYIRAGSAAKRKSVINGKEGDDVLSGDSQPDVFMIEKGNGSDAIVNFTVGTDAISLIGYGLKDFAAIKARMSASGADTIINLGNGEILAIRDHLPADFSSGDFFYPLDLSNYHLAFADEFDTFSRCVVTNTSNNACAGGIWRTNYKGTWKGAYADMYGRNLNQEEEIYLDPEFPGVDARGKLLTTPGLGINPFSLTSTGLRITAAKVPANIQPKIWDHKISSGAITTRGTYTQTNGYFEMRAKLPKGKGIWPAFWTLPADGAWPPEVRMKSRTPARSNTSLRRGISSTSMGANSRPGSTA